MNSPLPFKPKCYKDALFAVLLDHAPLEEGVLAWVSEYRFPELCPPPPEDADEKKERKYWTRFKDAVQALVQEGRIGRAFKRDTKTEVLFVTVRFSLPY